MKMHILAFMAAVGLTMPAFAATNTVFEFMGNVTSEAVSDGVDSFGDLGDAATITFNIVADATDLIPVGFISGGAAGLKVSGSDFIYDGGYVLDGFNDGFNDSISVDATGMFIATSSGFVTWPGEVGSTLRTTLSIDFGTPLGAAPTTYGELVTALQQPGSKATFITNGDFIFANGGPVADQFSVVASPAVAPVPLPAGGMLLITGFAVLAVARKKRQDYG
jgi:hypothetical protein